MTSLRAVRRAGVTSPCCHAGGVHSHREVRITSGLPLKTLSPQSNREKNVPQTPLGDSPPSPRAQLLGADEVYQEQGSLRNRRSLEDCRSSDCHVSWVGPRARKGTSVNPRESGGSRVRPVPPGEGPGVWLCSFGFRFCGADVMSPIAGPAGRRK